ncbi:DUF6973 domain-containing protein [Dyadobacter endophyticus]|uniref:DUF6973 domain-containing protein n=1 Tax=Dyadobacter endophyticus TaxID=1749036 RepID=A0ABQ1Z5H6_9BACT|nr:hypothetical protein [Dyadobacter endophyticus]GGH48299.1 hypothetical protein GCM10007423_49390 [Dyadobacter endophyticus]
MKKTLRTAFFFTTLAFGIASCNDPEVGTTNEPEVSKKVVVDFRGEKAIIPSNFPKELLSQSQEEFDRYFQGISKKSSLRTASDETNLTYESLLEILKRHTSSIPDVSYEKDFSEQDLKRIFVDFPEIKTAEDANSKKEIIYDYYQTLIKPDLIEDVITFESNNVNKRTLGGISPETLTVPERNHLIANPGYGQHYSFAAQESNHWTVVVYQRDADNESNNAFKHAIWNALSIRYILKGAPASENQAVDFTQDGTSKHEQDDNGNQIRTDASAMDLFNNMAARTWMKEETSWGIGPFRSMPSFEDIINNMKGKADASTVHTRAQILAPHGGDSDYVWNKLFDLQTGVQQYLVRLQ